MTDKTSKEAANVECWAAFELAMPNAATRTDEAWRGFQSGWQARAQHAQQAVESERGRVLEQAAKVCEDTEAETYKFGGQTFDSASGSLANAANAIRDLKGQQPAQADVGPT